MAEAPQYILAAPMDLYPPLARYSAPWHLICITLLLMVATGICASPQEYSVATPADFIKALMNESTTRIGILNDFSINEQDWAAVSPVLPIRVNRNLTISSRSSTGAYVIDFNFTAGKVLLGPTVSLDFDNLVLANTRFGRGWDFDFVSYSPNGTVLLRNSTKLQPACLPYNVSGVNNASRPASFPGQQDYGPVASICVHEDCYHGQLVYRDFALLVPVGYDESNTARLEGGYYIHMVDSYRLCQNFVSPACLARSSPLACVLALQAQARAGQAFDPNDAVSNKSGSSSGNGNSNGAWVIGLAVGVALAAAVIAGVVTLLVVRRRARRKQARDGGLDSGSSLAVSGNKSLRDLQLVPTGPGSDGIATGSSSLVSPSEGWRLVTLPDMEGYNSSSGSSITLGGVLGHGYFGKVYKAQWHGQVVAVKVLLHSVAMLPQVSNEVRLMMSFQHPNVVRALSVATWHKPSQQHHPRRGSTLATDSETTQTTTATYQRTPSPQSHITNASTDTATTGTAAAAAAAVAAAEGSQRSLPQSPQVSPPSQPSTPGLPPPLLQPYPPPSSQQSTPSLTNAPPSPQPSTPSLLPSRQSQPSQQSSQSLPLTTSQQFSLPSFDGSAQASLEGSLAPTLEISPHPSPPDAVPAAVAAGAAAAAGVAPKAASLSPPRPPRSNTPFSSSIASVVGSLEAWFSSQPGRPFARAGPGQHPADVESQSAAGGSQSGSMAFLSGPTASPRATRRQAPSNTPSKAPSSQGDGASNVELTLQPPSAAGGQPPSTPFKLPGPDIPPPATPRPGPGPLPSRSPVFTSLSGNVASTSANLVSTSANVASTSANAASNSLNAASTSTLLYLDSRAQGLPDFIAERTSDETTEAQTWIVEEYCDLGSLACALERGYTTHPQGGMHVERALLLLRDVCRGLDYLHSSAIVHGDLKGGNVLLTSAPGTPLGLIAKVCDFGLSRALSVGQTHASTRTLGTVTHMAPEMLRSGRVAKAADLYAFGVMMWEVATGQRPFSGMMYGEVVERVLVRDMRPPWPTWVPARYAALAERCWHSVAEARPTFAEVEEELAAMTADVEALQEEVQGRVDQISGWLA